MNTKNHVTAEASVENLSFAERTDLCINGVKDALAVLNALTAELPVNYTGNPDEDIRPDYNTDYNQAMKSYWDALSQLTNLKGELAEVISEKEKPPIVTIGYRYATVGGDIKDPVAEWRENYGKKSRVERELIVKIEDYLEEIGVLKRRCETY